MNSIKVSYTYKKQHDNLLKNLHQFYLDRLFCDVTVCVGHLKIPCHKVVLVSSSPYFRAMFTYDMAERNQEEITLQCLDPASFKRVVDYMYSADIEITNENVQSLFAVSSLLQISDLCAMCCVHMANEIHLVNCVNLFQFAYVHHSEQLKKAAKTFIVNHFREVNSSEEFLGLDADEVFEILQDDDLNVDDEYIVFSTVVSWLNKDFEKRNVYISKLLSAIRFSLFQEDMIEGLVASLEDVENSSFLRTCLMDVHKESQQNEPEAFRLGMYERIMFVFAGGSQSKHNRSLSCFDPTSKRNYYAIQPYLSFDFKYRIDYHKIVTTERNEIYLTGGVFYDVYHFDAGGTALNEVKVFDPFMRRWENKAKLLQPRCAHAMISDRNQLYVIGGKSKYPGGEALSSMEIYDPEEEQWSYGASLPVGLSHHGAVKHNGYIYVIGGYNNADNNTVNTKIFQYNINGNEWNTLEIQLNVHRAEFGITLLRDDVYIIAGDSGQFKVNAVEVLNLKTFEVRFVADFPEDRKSLSALCFQDEVYVCGGVRTIISRLNRSPRVVETRDLWKYTPASNEWRKEAKLVQYANIHGCTLAKVNVRRLFESEFISSV